MNPSIPALRGSEGRENATIPRLRVGMVCLSRQSLVLMIALVLVATTSSTAQENAKRFDEIGVKQCAFCHYAGSNQVLDQFHATEFARLDEFHRWLKEDSHALAFRLIDPNGTGESNQLSRRMCEKLNIDVTNFGQAANLKARDCLSCHAGWTNADVPPSPESLQYGVHCEACHGNASVWALPQNHQQLTWRKISPQEKLEKYGMRCLNQPLERAKLCYSCHIGSASENKVVTHAMYAAGHPPLPSIELASHSHSMGQHWRTIQEKNSFVFRDEYLQANHPYLRVSNGKQTPPEADLPQLRMLLVGGAMAIQQTVGLLQAESQDMARAWPDFAAYDCASCHHELRIQSDRQPISVPGEPLIPRGRPLFSNWPTTNSRLAASFLDSSDKGENGIRSLRAILAEKPFGSRDKIADPQGIATTLQTDFLAMAQQLAVKPLTARDGLTALHLLCEPPTDYRERADYEAARQRAWAIEIVSAELKGKLEFATDMAAFDATLNEISNELWLRLPNDARSNAMTSANTGITEERTKRLQAAGEYSPPHFDEQLTKLRTLLLE